MLDELKTLLGVKVLTKEEQKNLMGGRACCDPVNECCATRQMCSTVPTCPPVPCQCTSGCTYCHSDSMHCGCI